MTLERIAGLLIAGMLAFSAARATETGVAGQVAAHTPVRIGWQVPAATQAQVVQVLKRTNVLEIHGLEPRFVPYSFGTPQVEDALAGKLDVVFAGDQPAINLVARGGRWKIVGRLFYDRVALMVPPHSPIREVRELKGHTIASPFGSSGYREAIRQEEAAGLRPGTDVRNVDLDALEIRRRVQSAGVGAWDGIDAAAVWEPGVSNFTQRGLARILSAERTLGVIAMSDRFIADHPEAAVQFLVAVTRAWGYFSGHAARVGQWYIDDAQLGYTPEALLSAARVDPNLATKSARDIDLSLTAENLDSLERGAEWGRKQGDIRSGFQILAAVDQTLMDEARRRVAAGRFGNIEVILPSAREAPMTSSVDAYFFDSLPLALVFTVMIALSLLGIEGGRMLGAWRLAKAAPEPEGPVGTVAGAILGLLAFVIALTFAAAGNRFDARKQALLDEVNAIGTAYYRADLIPEPHRTTTRSLIREYVEIRLGMYRIYRNAEKLQTVQGRTAALQESIWSHAQTLATMDRDSPIYAMFAASLNDVFDLHTKRVVLGAQYRIPLFVWTSLLMVSCLAMAAVGFQFGIVGRRSLIADLALSVTFALVMLLIFALDRPGEGLIQVNQLPMIELYQSMGRQE